MDTRAIAVIVIGALWIMVADVMGSRKNRNDGRRGIVGDAPVRVERVSAIAALWGLMKGGFLFAFFVLLSTLYLQTHPPFWTEWWMLVGLIDIFAFALFICWKMPKSYRRYLDQKQKGQHAPFEYLYGAIASVLLIVGVGVHLMTLSEAPDWSLNP